MTSSVFNVVLATILCAVVTVAAADAQAADYPLDTLFGDAEYIVDLHGSDEMGRQHHLAPQCPTLVVYYDSTCGHCRSFAPQLKKFASEQHTSKRCVDTECVTKETVASPLIISAVNCNCDEQLCKARNVEDVPTIRFFHPRSADRRKTNFHATYRGAGVPPVINLTTPADQSEAYYREIPESGWAKAVTDLIGSWEAEQPTQASLAAQRSACSDVVGFLTDQKLFEMAVRDEAAAARKKSTTGKKKPTSHAVDPRGFDYRDVASAFYWSMWHEVPLARTSEVGRNALVEMLEIVASSLPGLGADRLLSARRADPFMSTAGWKKAVSQAWQLNTRLVEEASLQPVAASRRKIVVERGTGGGVEELVAPVPVWSVCRGSEPHFRGFPCGLWLMYHALLANAEPGTRFAALRSIRNYILNFFFCGDCQRHFSQFEFLPQRVSSVVGVSPDDEAVLMLWRAHNDVNNRLKSTPSSDPKYPKQVFPNKTACAECYLPPEDDSGTCPLAAPCTDADPPPPRKEDSVVDPNNSNGVNTAALHPIPGMNETEVFRFLMKRYVWRKDRAKAVLGHQSGGKDGEPIRRGKKTDGQGGGGLLHLVGERQKDHGVARGRWGVQHDDLTLFRWYAAAFVVLGIIVWIRGRNGSQGGRGSRQTQSGSPAPLRRKTHNV